MGYTHVYNMQYVEQLIVGWPWFKKKMAVQPNVKSLLQKSIKSRFLNFLFAVIAFYCYKLSSASELLISVCLLVVVTCCNYLVISYIALLTLFLI